MECFIGDGDLVVVSVHVKYKKPNDEEIYEEIWKYWDTKSGWLHREKFQDLIRERTKKD
ncbi:MAG TPA: hypothetical protein PKC24_01340 [Cyclobacteriaceae bacterium]|nr:hypothetical protein [Cyclobacteriaceae bacterium]